MVTTGFESGAVLVLPSRWEKITRLLEKDMTAAEHAAPHNVFLVCEQAVIIWGWEDLVLCQAMSHGVSMAAARASVVSTAGQQDGTDGCSPFLNRAR